jgi:hypothetical protein
LLLLIERDELDINLLSAVSSSSFTSIVSFSSLASSCCSQQQQSCVVDAIGKAASRYLVVTAPKYSYGAPVLFLQLRLFRKFSPFFDHNRNNEQELLATFNVFKEG